MGMPTCFHERLSPTSLAIADLCNYYNEGLIITRINVPRAHRGNGVGSRLLSTICAAADSTTTPLWLEIQSSDGLSHDELEAWYLRHGFQEYVTGIYRRQPQPSKESLNVPA